MVAMKTLAFILGVLLPAVYRAYLAHRMFVMHGKITWLNSG